MKPKVIITGSSGFVGGNLKKYLSGFFKIIDLSLRYSNNQVINLDCYAVIHLAGIAHDFSNKYTYDDYFKSNFKLTEQLYDSFLKSNSKIFIYVSSVKAVADKCKNKLNEDTEPNPKSFYGKTKLLSEKYIHQKKIPSNKKVFILRPCMLHGRNNKGNLNLLYKLCKYSFPWPLGNYNNKRSFCSINNFCFVVDRILKDKNIKSGLFNVSDDYSFSTNELIRLMYKFRNKKPVILKIPKFLIKISVSIGDLLKLPLNSQSFSKLTESYEVSNKKIKKNLGIKNMPLSFEDGLKLTLRYFN